MPPEAGDLAPDFTLPDATKQPHTLSSYRGRCAVVVHFFPFAFTRTCEDELLVLRADTERLRAEGVEILAVSCDPPMPLRVWAEREGFDFPLLSDFWPHGAVAQTYGVFNDKRGCAYRATFLVDRDGVVRWSVVNDLPDARDPDSLRRAVAALRAAG
jgi:mycoredoxin-dependent peroxiredoxin